MKLINVFPLIFVTLGSLVKCSLSEAEAAVSERFPVLPSFFVGSLEDYDWILGFTPEEVAGPSFWITALLACDNGFKLKSCPKLAQEISDSIVSADFYIGLPGISNQMLRILLAHGHYEAALMMILSPIDLMHLITDKDIDSVLDQIVNLDDLRGFLIKLFKSDSNTITKIFTRLLVKFPLELLEFDFTGLCTSKYVLKAILKSAGGASYPKEKVTGEATFSNLKAMRRAQVVKQRIIKDFCVGHEKILKGLKMNYEMSCLEYFTEFNEYLHSNGSLDYLEIEDAVELIFIKKDYESLVLLILEIPDIDDFFYSQQFVGLLDFSLFEGKNRYQIPERVNEAFTALVDVFFLVSRPGDEKFVGALESLTKFNGIEKLSYETEYLPYINDQNKLIDKLQRLGDKVQATNLFNLLILMKTDPVELALWTKTILKAFPHFIYTLNCTLFLTKASLPALKEVLKTKIAPLDFIFESQPIVPLNWTSTDLLQLIQDDETWHLLKSKTALIGKFLLQLNGPEIFKRTIPHLSTEKELKRFRRLCVLFSLKDIFGDGAGERDFIVKREFMKFYGRFIYLNGIF